MTASIVSTNSLATSTRPSDTTISNLTSPLKFCGGVPDNVKEVLSKLSQLGKATPPSPRKLIVNSSPSTSLNKLDERVLLKETSSVPTRVGRSPITGASLTASIARTSPFDVSTVPSNTTTSRGTFPLKSCGGVPLKVIVSLSKLNQLGNTAPLSPRTVIVKSSPSTSLKRLEENTVLKVASSLP